MPANTFGEVFRITTFGESHGLAVGVVIDGCPAGLELAETDIQPDLNRRRTGQSHITTSRQEPDQIKIYSGVFEGKTTGAPIMLMVENQEFKSEDYLNMKDKFRPGHADYTVQTKFGVRDWRGGGRTSIRITIGRVAAGAVAKKFLKQKLGIEFFTFVDQVGPIRLPADFDISQVTFEQIEASIVRCPDSKVAEKMINLIETCKAEGDSIGGVIHGLIKNLPVGLGEPEFDKLPALLSHAMLSINATKGFEIGSGFAGVELRGSQHNDEFETNSDGQISLKTNHAGGTLGGLSDGAPVDFRLAFKPTSTIAKTQQTVDSHGQNTTIEGKGRHDPCVVPRAVAIVEAMSALVIMDLYARNKVGK